MHVVILGAGALGSVYGGYLARAGHEVTLIGRARHMDAIAHKGLRISGQTYVTVPATPPGSLGLHVATDPSQVTDVDLLLICVKTRDTEAVLDSARHLQPQSVASLQNGISKDDRLVEVFGRERVLGATSIVGASMPEPGHVVMTMAGGTWFGELDNRSSSRVLGVVDAFRSGGLQAEVPVSIQSAEWSKLCQILPAATLSALTRLKYHQLCQNPDLAHLFVQLTCETAAVAQACGVEVNNYPGFPIRSLVSLPAEEAVKSIMIRGQNLEASGNVHIEISMLQDILAGKHTEIEAVAGDVLRLAQRHTVSVPGISFVYHAVRGIEAWL